MLVTIIELLLGPVTCLVCMLLRFFLSYSYYFFGIVLLKAAYKYITEVCNGCWKLKPSSNQAILITGATSGIGLSLAKHFHKLGYSVIVGYYSKEEVGYGELMKLNEQSKEGNSLYFVSINVRSQESISESYKLVSKLVADNDLQLHALINNAGVAQFQMSQWDSPSSMRTVVETNLLGPILMSRQYLPLIAKADYGRIVNVGSIVSFIPLSPTAVYGGTKAGLSYYTNSLALVIDRYNVKAVMVHPGNAMQHTSILHGCVSNSDALYEQMSQDERAIFGQDFRTYQQGLGQYAKRLEQGMVNKSLGKDSADSQRKSSSKSNRGNSLFKYLTTLRAVLAGSLGRGVKLEESELMDSFDNAIRLKNPPMEMFAGNRFFSIVVCALMECLGSSTRRILALLVARGGLLKNN